MNWKERYSTRIAKNIDEFKIGDCISYVNTDSGLTRYGKIVRIEGDYIRATFSDNKKDGFSGTPAGKLLNADREITIYG